MSAEATTPEARPTQEQKAAQIMQLATDQDRAGAEGLRALQEHTRQKKQTGNK